MRTVVEQLRRVALLGSEGGPSDGELVESFLIRQDATAFEALLRRHGPMVLGVCRRILRNAHDADDAFQATFLVLARKAADIRPRDMVGHWLYGVAYRTARKALAMNAKRRNKERRALSMCRYEESEDGPPEELLARLDAEVARLPEKYRVPVVLCELEGKSRKQVAKLLSLPEGTLSWRLAHARKLLAQRLAPYGTMLSAGALAAVLTPDTACARVPPTLLAATVRAGLQTVTAGTVSAQVMTLTEGVLKAMFYSKLKLMGTLVLALAVSAGVGLSYRASAADPTQPGKGVPTARAAADELEELRLEVAALRKGLEAMRARVKALESERQTAGVRQRGLNEAPLRLPAKRAGAGTPENPYRLEIRTEARTPREVHLEPHMVTRTVTADVELEKVEPVKVKDVQIRVEPVKVQHYNVENYEVRLVLDPIAQAEAALQQLRKNPNDKQAMQNLANASKALKERSAHRVAPAQKK
ncbi:MAG TPA: sigma-70 family RNA polymerase sigma factor [Gemmataceae bacterium]|nr:sigma-70 family RNA polymerase sigma factor [Gemmataceae bacterium]